IAWLPALSTMKDAWFWGAPWLRFNLFPILVALSSSRGDADRSLKLASLVVVRCQPWIYLRVARRAGGRRLPGSFPATRCDGGYSRRPGPHRESPSCDTTLSGDSCVNRGWITACL